VYPERLDGGEDLLLVASEGHAHSEQVSVETERMRVFSLSVAWQAVVQVNREINESHSVLICETMSKLVNPACRKLCSYRSIFMARSHSETEPQADRSGGTRWSSRG